MDDSFFKKVFQIHPKIRFVGIYKDEKLQYSYREGIKPYIDADTTGKSLTDMGYVTHTLSFTAIVEDSQLIFASRTSGACGPVIDNVILTENIPEPEDGKVTVCHKPGTPAEKTLEVPEEALKGHLKHGDTLGPCDGLPPDDTPGV